jgi:hypothetical protein
VGGRVLRSRAEWVEILRDNRPSQRLTEEELQTVTSLLESADDEEDREILGVIGRRTLTDDERERVRDLLALKLMERGVLPDGSMNEEGRAIDEIIGKLMFY